ncbi:hypothetical protein FRC12_007120 [Ceratobasidium sp. 428]|nr:hypothetical protein FRC12_007120 [Ceratobasidium sp. 428]
MGAELRAFREHEMENYENSTLSNVHPEYEPVLIWSMTGLDDQTTHNLRLALASLPSDDNAEMTIAKVVYTKVSYEPGQSRPDIPIPRQDPQHDGPTYPPHAENWAPRRPSLPSPVPSRLPAPSNPRPTVPQAPLPPSSPPDSAPNSTDIVLLVVALIAISLVLLVVYLSLLVLDRGERSPLLSRLRGGALAYSNNGIRAYAKA